MNTFSRHVLLVVVLVGIGHPALGAFTAASPFVGSVKVAHATLYLNVDQRARQILPLEISAVNGALTNRSDQGVVWIRPGEYTFKVRVSEPVNLADLSGLVRRAASGHAPHTLSLQVKAGQAYYLGAQFQTSGHWKPVVWKIANVGRPMRSLKP